MKKINGSPPASSATVTAKMSSISTFATASTIGQAAGAHAARQFGT